VTAWWREENVWRELTRSSSLIFSGTVMERGSSTVPALPPSQKLVVVRVDRPLRVDPVLGNIQGKMITVAATAPEKLGPGQQAVFFTNSWIHGRGIAVRESGYVDVQEEGQVTSAVAQLPHVHLMDRLRDAELVVDAQVTRVRPVEKRSSERNVALWATAELRVRKVMRGHATQSTRSTFQPRIGRKPLT
jgi:hypothetical protein